MQRSRPCGEKSAFTLVELLTVISIIAILVALLMPALASFRRRGKLVVCSNNVHQLGLAAVLYTHDFGVFPYLRHPNYATSSAPMWPEWLLPYLVKGNYSRKSNDPTDVENYMWPRKDGVDLQATEAAAKLTKIFNCPAAPRPADNSSYSRTYACNGILFMWTGGGASPPLQKQNEVASNDAHLGTLILFTETGIFPAGTGDWMWCSAQSSGGENLILADFVANPVTAATKSSDIVTTAALNNGDNVLGFLWPVYTRHDGLCVTVMADGHVQLFKNGEIRKENYMLRAKGWSTAASSWVDMAYP